MLSNLSGEKSNFALIYEREARNVLQLSVCSNKWRIVDPAPWPNQ